MGENKINRVRKSAFAFVSVRRRVKKPFFGARVIAQVILYASG